MVLQCPTSRRVGHRRPCTIGKEFQQSRPVNSDRTDNKDCFANQVDLTMDDLAQLMNASASHQEVTENGPPAQPLPFPPPTVGRAHRVTAIVHNPATSEEAQVPNVVYEARSDGAAPVRGYWIGRKLKKAIYGCVRSCTVLRLRPGSTWTGPESGAAGGGAAWEVTPEMAAVKIMDWNLVRDLRGRHMEDPVKEVSAMQYLCTDGGSPNVLGTLDVMSDEQYLYSFMPFCSCGELFGYVERDGRFSEPVARFWFRQLLNVSFSSFLFEMYSSIRSIPTFYILDAQHLLGIPNHFNLSLTCSIPTFSVSNPP